MAVGTHGRILMEREKRMATTGKGRRIVDVLEDLLAEARTANALTALQLGTATLDDEALTSDVPTTRRRVARRNDLRATVRAGLHLEEVDGADHTAG